MTNSHSGVDLPDFLVTTALSLVATPAQRHTQAVAWQQAGRHDLAEREYRLLLEEAPGDPALHNNLGVLLAARGRQAEALSRFQHAVDLFANYVDANANVAVTLWALGRTDEAEAITRAALVRVPDAARLHKTLGVLLLQRGEYAEGWREYEARFEADGCARMHRNLPRWKGGPRSGPLLVWAEQGIGDEVMYASMITDLLRQSGEVWLACDPRLGPLLGRSFPGVRLFPRWAEVIPGAACQIPLASLGSVLRPSLDAFPADRLSYLRPDLARTRALRERFGGKRAIGVSWSSSGSSFAAGKTAPLSAFAPLAQLPDTVLVDLQYGDTASERCRAECEGAPVLHLDDLDLRNDLDGLAALIAACDEVVTISNVTAHLAGALGRPTTVLVPAGMAHLWFWGNEGEACAWYPMAALERQRTGEPWAEVVSRAAATPA